MLDFDRRKDVPRNTEWDLPVNWEATDIDGILINFGVRDIGEPKMIREDTSLLTRGAGIRTRDKRLQSNDEE
jgi:hypothetical protein